MNPVRPTSSKLLQAFFNIIGTRKGLSLLDLFAGTGRVGLEAARQGFGPVVAVEIDSRACRNLRVDPGARAGHGEFEVLCMDVRRAMIVLARKSRTFDVIFADPPYENGWVSAITKGDAFLWPHLLAEGGVFVLEHSTREKVPEGLEALRWETRQYGDSCLSFFRPCEKE
jgi:16S rRNA (guanine(966)-N(2))-methyltransferase RsmD